MTRRERRRAPRDSSAGTGRAARAALAFAAWGALACEDAEVVPGGTDAGSNAGGNAGRTGSGPGGAGAGGSGSGGKAALDAGTGGTEGPSAAGATHSPLPADGGDAGSDAPPSFTMRVLASGLAAPWEISWGPDGLLWVTERDARRVVRVRPEDGSIASSFTIDEATTFSAQDGLLGLAVHPGLLQDGGTRFVYVAYTYGGEEADDGNDAGAGTPRRTKLRRYAVDVDTGALTQPFDLITDLPASDDHNSGRLVFGPDQHLYYTVGDQGSNQFATVCNPVRSQALPTTEQIDARDYTNYAGKILRLELDGSIPEDNPELAGTRSHVYSYGHRNAQGIVFANGRLYSDEHGAKTDDELNLIQAGSNYGWPNVSGYRDDLAYVYGNWSASSPTPCEQLEYSDYVIPESVPLTRETDFDAPDLVSPLMTFYTVGSDHEFQDPACPGNEYICWPTIAPSSLDFYGTSGAIPGWESSLLLSSLKQGALLRVRLAPDGESVVGAAEAVLRTGNRYRDLAIAPGGATIYVVTDVEGSRVGPGGGVATGSEQPGSILEFRYAGAN